VTNNLVKFHSHTRILHQHARPYTVVGWHLPERYTQAKCALRVSAGWKKNLAHALTRLKVNRMRALTIMIMMYREILHVYEVH